MNNKKDFFEKTSIGKLLFKMSLPATIGMLVMSLYNIVDAIFVGHYIGPLGFGAVILVFPIMLLIISLSVGFGMGASSLISLKLGAKKLNEANKIFSNFILLTFFLALFIFFLGYFFIDKILILLGSTPKIFPYAKSYLFIILFGIYFQMFAASSNGIIRAQGSAKIAMFSMIIGTVSNIILDYIFIVKLNLGISGIAYATIISQFLTFIFAIWYFFSKHSILKIKLKNLKLKFSIIKNIIVLGFPTFIRQISMGIVILITNNLIKIYGSNLILASYGIFFQLLMLSIMPSIGILQGSQSIMGYNYGAKKFNRVKEILKLSIKSSTIILLITYILVMIFPQIFIKIFTSNLDLINSTSNIIRILLFMMPLITFQFMVSGFLQSTGKAKPALIISLLRQFIILIPLLLILPLFFGLNGIWYSYPISDFVSFIIVYFIFKKEYDKLIPI